MHERMTMYAPLQQHNIDWMLSAKCYTWHVFLVKLFKLSISRIWIQYRQFMINTILPIINFELGFIQNIFIFTLVVIVTCYIEVMYIPLYVWKGHINFYISNWLLLIKKHMLTIFLSWICKNVTHAFVNMENVQGLVREWKRGGYFYSPGLIDRTN